MVALSTNARLVAVLILLGGVASFLQARRQPEVSVPYKGLAQFPISFEGWQGTEIPISDETRAVLGKGEFLQRIYRGREGAPVDVFIAYFPSQRVGVTIHSPKNCLPGSGWAPVESSYVAVPLSDREIVANRYIVAKGESRQLVLYWYQAHGRAIASEYWAKFYLVKDAIAMNRSDGSLIRVVTSLDRGEKIEVAQARALSFVGSLMPELAQVVPQ